MDMITFSAVKKEHREQLLKHICRHALQHAPSADELYRINRLLDQKKTIVETLAMVRQFRGDDKCLSIAQGLLPDPLKTMTVVNSIFKNSSYTSLRTPLEKYFHEYVSL